MIRWKSLIFCWNSSRVGNAISDSSLIGVPSCFSGGRKIVKWTRSTLASDFSRLRQVRSPACGSPDTSSTRSLSRTPSIDTTARLLTGGQFVLERRGFDLDDVRPGVRDRDLRVDGAAGRDGAAVQHLAVAADGDLGGRRPRALVLDAIDDGLRLADDAEARRRHQHDAAVALVAGAGDERMDRRVEAQRRDFGRDVMHAAVGEHDGAGDAVGRHVGERRVERREQLGAVGFAVGFAGFDEAHVEAGNAAEPFGQQRARGLGLLQAVAEILARALVDHHRDHRRQRLAVLAGERRIRQRQHHHGERKRPHRPAAAPREREQRHQHDRNARPPPTARRQEPAVRM